MFIDTEHVPIPIDTLSWMCHTFQGPPLGAGVVVVGGLIWIGLESLTPPLFFFERRQVHGFPYNSVKLEDTRWAVRVNV